ncbi:HEPN domain-containing protein [Pseudomonas fulva]|uniref:HEPN domain-containing protein n=1 Tax=Pseudomonas fulva TaxID=47880 RepID=UPI0018AA7D5F|nr:HEPN domain-containing protein [Pseudomonas fulva]MBF8673663.1 HEPN domain-containing protein [Pseudomonas fulva]MBF8696163.1 HEPN domain-containing protein [Pseudomonas fulva]
MAKFSWPAYPASEIEFEQLMAAIDKALASEDLKPFQRPFHVGRLFWEAFGWGGRMTPPDELADLPGYQGEILMAKALRWYTDTLGNRLKSYFELGYVPAKLAQTIWRVRIAGWYGSVEFFLHRNLLNKGSSKGSQTDLPSMNILTLVEDLPQGLVNRLADDELERHFIYHMFAVENIQWLNNLPRTNMLSVAKGDYAGSTQELIAHRYPQSRWAAQQCVEKTLKGFLEIAGISYPKGGRDGHNLGKLAKILHDECEVSINSHLIDMAHCSTGARYQDEPSTENQAFQANVAALHIFDSLRKSQGIVRVLENYYKKNPIY